MKPNKEPSTSQGGAPVCSQPCLGEWGEERWVNTSLHHGASPATSWHPIFTSFTHSFMRSTQAEGGYPLPSAVRDARDTKDSGVPSDLGELRICFHRELLQPTE